MFTLTVGATITEDADDANVSWRIWSAGVRARSGQASNQRSLMLKTSREAWILTP